MIQIEVRPAPDPAGRPGVLVQLPNGWVVLQPADARVLAEALIDCATEVEAG